MGSRRDFLRSAAAAGATAFLPGSAAAQAAWDRGQLVHLLPTVSHDRALIKASFAAPLAGPPRLAMGDSMVRGERTDRYGANWQFDVPGLAPDRRYRLALDDGRGKALAEPWSLATFPAPDARPERLRVLFYCCAGGHEALPPVRGRTLFTSFEMRRRLLRRGLSFAPDAVVANGDHVYWDLFAPLAGPFLGGSKAAIEIAGRPDPRLPVLGTANEEFLRKAAGPQITSIYGVDFRSTPVFFLMDDHDYFENDEATDEIVTFPPSHFLRELARATQHLWYPEFLPDPNRPLGLPGASAPDRPSGVSEIFGTLRYGTLAEILLFDVRRTATLAGPSAVYVDPVVEGWLKERMAAPGVTHVVNGPSNPPGWSAGKWGEWYPDVLGKDGKLTTAEPKPYWQSGWLKQHDRLMAAMSAMKGRVPLVVSGDLHAVGEGRILRSGNLDLSANPVVTVLPGPVSTGDIAWPSGIRQIRPNVPKHLDMQETLVPIEQHGFVIADFTPDKIVLRYFRWDVKKQPLEALDTLEPFRTAELARPS
jgi:hypothetical protein